VDSNLFTSGIRVSVLDGSLMFTNRVSTHLRYVWERRRSLQRMYGYLRRTALFSPTTPSPLQSLRRLRKTLRFSIQKDVRLAEMHDP
jgi:hypothetical protein